MPKWYEKIHRNIHKTSLLLISADLLGALACGLLALVIRFRQLPPLQFDLANLDPDLSQHMPLVYIAPFVLVCTLASFSVYGYKGRVYHISDDISRLVLGICLANALMVIIAFFDLVPSKPLVEFRSYTYSRFFFFYNWGLNLLAVISIHTFVGITRNELLRRGYGLRTLVIQGIGEQAKQLAANAELLAASGYSLVGFVADNHSGERVDVRGKTYPVLGESSALLDIVNTHNVNEIVVTNVRALPYSLLEFSNRCHELNVGVRLAPDLHGLFLQRQPVEELAGLPVLRVDRLEFTGMPLLIKRIEDIVLASLGLVVLSPLIVCTAILVKLESPGPVFFSQQRTGKNGRAFRMYKFRSMYKDAEARRSELEKQNEADGVVFKIKDDPRVTRVGKVIRKTSIDEVPQFFNVLKGEMSLIGPRPLPRADIARPDDWEAKRFNVTPGITGMWQVNRVEHSSEEMLKWDLYYIENWSLKLDLQILLKTVIVVLTGKGAY